MAALMASWQVWAVLAALFAAATALLAKAGVETVDPDLATWLRTLVVAVALGGLVWASGKLSGVGTITGRAAVYLGLSGLATGASWLCYFRALKLGDAGRVAPVDKLSVVFVAVLAALLLGERLSGMAWTGVGLIALGAMLVAIG
jgi:transporter family protein